MNFEEWLEENRDELQNDFVDMHEDMFEHYCRMEFDDDEK